jgi:hypothetical protein
VLVRRNGCKSLGLPGGDFGGPEWKFAKSVIEDFRGAKDHLSRKEHYGTLQAVLASRKYPAFSHHADAVPTVLSEFESISDPETSSAFYRKHRAELLGTQDETDKEN